MQSGSGLFEEALEWLHKNYASYRFCVERDLVWTVQTRLNSMISQMELPLQVFHGYPILPGKKQSLCADLAIVDSHGKVQLAAEFKYEPSHSRTDILKRKFPVVLWDRDGVGHDVRRVKEIVERGRAEVAYSLFVDEGGYFRRSRLPFPQSEWLDWGNGVWVLWSRVAKGELGMTQ
jgi:hypothetical protein